MGLQTRTAPSRHLAIRNAKKNEWRILKKALPLLKCVIDEWGRNRCCRGVDLNRNFDFHFKGTRCSIHF